VTRNNLDSKILMTNIGVNLAVSS